MTGEALYVVSGLESMYVNVHAKSVASLVARAMRETGQITRDTQLWSVQLESIFLLQ
jgi:hypothetical protein